MMDPSQGQWSTMSGAQAPTIPGTTQQNNPSVTGGISNMISALMNGNKQYQASQAGQNVASGYNPNGSMSGAQWQQAGQGQGPYAAMAGTPSPTGGPPPFGPNPNGGIPFMGAGGGPSANPGMMSALMSQPPM